MQNQGSHNSNVFEPKKPQYTTTTIVKGTVKTGISFGSGLAMVISFVEYGSVLRAMIHGVLGWLYVIYYVLFVN